MIDFSRLLSTFADHGERVSRHVEAFARAMPQIEDAEQARFHSAFRRSENAMTAHLDDHFRQSASGVKDNLHLHQHPFENKLLSKTTERSSLASRLESPWSISQSIQPVRDLVLGDIVVLGGDRKLDFFGPPYSSGLLKRAGNANPFYQPVYANRASGELGFSQYVTGSAAGYIGRAMAGVYVQFVPAFAPGVAQVRPYLPFAYQWLSLYRQGRAANEGALGIRVYSFDFFGSDRVVELDHSYFVWRNVVEGGSGTAESPSWTRTSEDDDERWDYDYGFHFNDVAPYFRTRPGRIYIAEISCSGMVFSTSSDKVPGFTIGSLEAKVPIVVVGYQ